MLQSPVCVCVVRVCVGVGVAEVAEVAEVGGVGGVAEVVVRVKIDDTTTQQLCIKRTRQPHCTVWTGATYRHLPTSPLRAH